MIPALGSQEESVNLQFGEWLRVRRDRAGLTQGDVALRLVVTRQAVSNWENGVSLPTLDPVKMQEFCLLIGCKLEEIALRARNKAFEE